MYKGCYVYYDITDNNFWINYEDGQRAWDTPYKTHQGAVKVLRWLQT